MSSDILTQFFESMPFDRARATLSELYSPWGLALPGRYLTGFHAALEGSWELHVPPLAPIKMHAGDIAFFPVGRPHGVRDHATTGLVPLTAVLTAVHRAKHTGLKVIKLCHGGSGERTRILTVFLPAGIPWRTPVLGAMPLLILVPGEGEKPARAVAPFVERLAEEVELRRPGYLAASRRLIELLIIEMLRMKADNGEIDAGLLNTLGDPGICAALTAMHQEVDRDWTVSELATLAGMSRSLFAARFAALVGVAPHRYLVRLRLQHAAQLLRSQELTVVEVSDRVGYRSESSFSRVFTREMGEPSRDVPQAARGRRERGPRGRRAFW